MCVLCCQKRSTITFCGECEEHYCAECIDPYLWDQCCLLSTIQMTFGVVDFIAIAFLCNVICREGVQSNMVYSGGFSMRG